jgi:hypothetical protein
MPPRRAPLLVRSLSSLTRMNRPFRHPCRPPPRRIPFPPRAAADPGRTPNGGWAGSAAASALKGHGKAAGRWTADPHPSPPFKGTPPKRRHRSGAAGGHWLIGICGWAFTGLYVKSEPRICRFVLRPAEVIGTPAEYARPARRGCLMPFRSIRDPDLIHRFSSRSCCPALGAVASLLFLMPSSPSRASFCATNCSHSPLHRQSRLRASAFVSCPVVPPRLRLIHFFQAERRRLAPGQFRARRRTAKDDRRRWRATEGTNERQPGRDSQIIR